jgi:hypothetical protein
MNTFNIPRDKATVLMGDISKIMLQGAKPEAPEAGGKNEKLADMAVSMMEAALMNEDIDALILAATTLPNFYDPDPRSDDILERIMPVLLSWKESDGMTEHMRKTLDTIAVVYGVTNADYSTSRRAILPAVIEETLIDLIESSIDRNLLAGNAKRFASRITSLRCQSRMMSDEDAIKRNTIASARHFECRGKVIKSNSTIVA